jgi:hypothetical protein
VLAALALAGAVFGAGAAKAWEPRPGPRVLESGAGPVQEADSGDRVLSWGAVVGNPRGKAAVGTYLRVEALDDDGHVVDHTNAYVSVIPPRGSTGVAGTFEHPDDAVEVRVTVDGVASWLPADDQLLGEVRVKDLTVVYSHADVPLIRFTAVSTYDRTIAPVGDVIFRDAHGRIVGGAPVVGFDPIDLDDQATAHVLVDFPVPKLARVEAYVSPSEEDFSSALDEARQRD